ncbi:FabG-like 3-oxoacyl-(acyl-carrier-protein) reductase [Paraconexibacter sp. AEG42_29]|uniref:FabG-like 3-oxoacyl-(Acyl-carrier-protein) reductase n=1 Tax=Paraconexibacter sp. AEG42_29 TaxID=2997339 RepID=A0AAU7AQC9_9ACTN
MIASVLDRALDLTVAPGYSRVGYELRRRGWPGRGDDLPQMEGRTVVVTGATGGIGRAAAERFAALGARVVLVGRSQERADTARREIVAATGNQDVAIVLADLASLDSVQAAVDTLKRDEAAIHVLVNNAGVMSDTRQLSVDGHELTFATNLLGTFALTEGLRELLVESAPARIVTVSSGGMYSQKLRLDDLQTARMEYAAPAVYARTKRGQVVLTEWWADQLRGTGVTVHAMHPGWADTPGVETSLPRFHSLLKPVLRTPEQGADTIVWLGAAAEPGRTSGRFWHDRRPRPVNVLPTTRGGDDDGERLSAALRDLVSAPR